MPRPLSQRTDSEVRAIIDGLLAKQGYDFDTLFGPCRARSEGQVLARRWVYHEAMEYVGVCFASLGRVCGIDWSVIRASLAQPKPEPPDPGSMGCKRKPRVRRLTDEQWAALERKRHAGEGMTVEETAAYLGVSRQHVQQTERRAMEKLRAAMKESANA